MAGRLNVTVWNEFIHERHDAAIAKIYPDGIHAVIATYLNRQEGIQAKTATLDQPEHGLSEEVLANTDVLSWWGHAAHDKVSDEVVERVQKRVLEGMGLICLHSSHYSKIFKRMLGTTCSLRYREAAEKERLWNVEPSHPVAQGIGDFFELPHTEMYGERFDIPTPDKVIFISWFQGGEVFRSGCVWERGHGRIFYFKPGHETHPIFYDENVMRVVTNAVRWTGPRIIKKHRLSNVCALEEISRR